MTSVIVVGGGPAGLSAALFAAKNGLDATVFDTDETWMHKAHLFNYPGIGSIGGSEFMAVTRQQVDDFGVERRQGEAVTGVAAALNILSKEKGEHFHDFDVPADASETFGAMADE